MFLDLFTARNEALKKISVYNNTPTTPVQVNILANPTSFARRSFLAVNRSKNTYVKLLGIYISFRWLFAWIEDISDVSLNYFMIMTMIGLCFSYSFRNMTDNEVIVWVRGVFDIRYVRLQQYLMSKSKTQEKKPGQLINLSTQED